MNSVGIPAADRDAVLRQLRSASRRLNADCELCQLQTICRDLGRSCTPDVVHAEKNMVIFSQGERDDYVYSLRQGAVKALRHLAQRDEEQVLGFHFSGELFGLDGLAATPRRNAAVAIEDSTLCRLPLQPLTAGRYSARGFSQLLQMMGRDALALKEHAVLVNRSQSGTRLAAFLLDLASRIGRVHDNGDISVVLAMGRQDIASYLGLTIETVSRRLCEMERDGLLRLNEQRKTVHMLAIDRLQQIAFY